MCGRNAIIGDGSLALWLALAWLLPVLPVRRRGAFRRASGRFPLSARPTCWWWAARRGGSRRRGGRGGACLPGRPPALSWRGPVCHAPPSARRAPLRRVDREGICRPVRDHPDACETDPEAGARLVRGGLLLSCYPTDVLVDAGGGFAGVVLANRAGRQAVVAKVLIDATDRAVVAKMAGRQAPAMERRNARMPPVVMGGNDKPVRGSTGNSFRCKTGRQGGLLLRVRLRSRLGRRQLSRHRRGRAACARSDLPKGKRASSGLRSCRRTVLLIAAAAEQWQQDSPCANRTFSEWEHRSGLRAWAGGRPAPGSGRELHAGPSEAAGRQDARRPQPPAA